MWHFTEIDNDSRTITDPTALTVQSHGELTQLQIFVREVLQNSLDNQVTSEPVRVDFRLKYVTGEEKDHFLEALDFHEIAPHIRAVNKYQRNRNRTPDIPDPATLHNKNYVLRLLYIEDFGTRGLIGPEHSRETDRFPFPHCFLGLCRNIGDSQKGEEIMGGTYGLGKTVLWKNSRLRLVMFHSRLITPYTSHPDGIEHWTRCFGHVRFTGHDLANQAYKGEGFWGHRSEDLTSSVYDDEANMQASRLGFISRNKKQHGTSVLVVDFDDPDLADDEETEIDSIERICESAELYFWPAMWDGRLRVRGRAESEHPDAWKIAPTQRPELWPFVEAYTVAKLKSTRSAVAMETLDTKIPKGPNARDPVTKSKIVICANLKADDSNVPTTYLNRTALIRGAGMVVGYQKIGRPGFGGRDFWSIVLGGKSCPKHISLTPQQSERCEQLLAFSEPVTHDTWTQNSEGLKKWRGARAEIVRILAGIKKAITTATSAELKPEGRASSLLASMFPLSEGVESDGSRDMSLEVLSQPTPVESDDGQLRYEFHIAVHVPARDAFQGLHKPSIWRVECEYGFYGEDIRRKVVENVALQFTHIRKNGSGWKELRDFGNSYEDVIQDHELSYEFKGRTTSMESFIALITKHELQIKVLKRY